ncbi:MAG TPA: carboxymuconolactone decarboxylase family protein [Chthonomonadaceae bacterium]|nr:carboxymuconolactone decarboxylase family protein [Chthonomonadaceae bacterium]
MQARMNNPVMIVPDAMQALYALGKAAKKGSVPSRTHLLVHLRASQINGCSVCVDMHARELKQAGETDERLFAVAAWRDAPYFTDAERAALALTEAVTRLSDREDPVPDAVWQEAARHYDEPGLAALLLSIAMINTWNRLNVATRQVAGEWMKSAEAQEWVERSAEAH